MVALEGYTALKPMKLVRIFLLSQPFNPYKNSLKMSLLQPSPSTTSDLKANFKLTTSRKKAEWI